MLVPYPAQPTSRPPLTFFNESGTEKTLQVKNTNKFVLWKAGPTPAVTPSSEKEQYVGKVIISKENVDDPQQQRGKP